MSKLSKSWLTDPHIDVEYKSYILLAYLQEAKRVFEEKNLYPTLSELIEHYAALYHLKHSSEWVRELFPKQLIGLNIKEKALTYETLVHDDMLLEEIWKTIEFSIPVLEERIHEGKQIFEYIENNIHVEPIGIIPIRITEGYMFINIEKDTAVFKYEMSPLSTSSTTSMRALRTAYISTYPQSLNNTYTNIKYDLIRHRAELPNPAVFLFQTDLKIPFQTCYLPIVKRLLMLYLQQTEAEENNNASH